MKVDEKKAMNIIIIRKNGLKKMMIFEILTLK